MKFSTKMLALVAQRSIVILLAIVLLFSTISFSKAADAGTDTVERLNVMLVIDGSGSLPSGTDRKGLRYDAIDLFLALLTNEGNNVGAIVFNHRILLETECNELVGKAEKMNLAKQIRQAGAKGDTDIGTALLAAVDKTIAKSQENQMDSVIILFSDGRTDVPGGQAAMDASLENKRIATEKARDNGIPVYSICLNASDVASPEELKQISDETNGSFVEVNKAEDLTPAFEAFYNLIFPNTCNKLTQTTFSEEGVLNTDIAIPTYGAEEVNIILNVTNVTDIEVVAPSGVLTPEQIDDTTMSGGYYDVIKLVDPDNGNWQVNLSGKPGTEVTINVLYNIDSFVELSLDNGQTDYQVGESATFRATFLNQGQTVADSSVTQEYSAKLHLMNLSTGAEEIVDMTPDANGTFVYTLSGSDYCGWNVYAELAHSHLVLTSNELQVRFGNTAPVANPSYIDVPVTVTPFSGKSHSMDISTFFSDAQDRSLSYEIYSSQLVQDTVVLNEKTGELTVNTAKSKSGEVIVRAKDSQGAEVDLTIMYDVNNLTWLILGGGGAIILALLILIIILLYISTHKSWKGMLNVTTLDGAMTRSHGGFRGKLPLKRLGIYGCGLDGELVATGRNCIEFRSKKPIYSGTGIQPNPKRIPLMNGINTIYGDMEHTNGIEVDISGQDGGFGGGGFGPDGFGY